MNGFNSNTYTTSDWSKMESNGAVFLPAAGYCHGSVVGDVGSDGYYWSSSAYDLAGHLCFYSDNAVMNLGSASAYVNGSDRYYGLSVRLVRGL
ncbi:MAG: hypothetical protein MJ198_07745, partial [Bacteroidales bacterium]|nr:hypothetical protein [Bacteroidales bacterium]